MQENQRIAKETLKIIGEGRYTVDGVICDIKSCVDEMKNNTKIYDAPKLEAVREYKSNNSYNTQIEITNETTISAILRLRENYKDVIALNFASAKNPGGGFLHGSQAQEESIARATTIYTSLTSSLPMSYYYQPNRRDPKYGLYNDCVIYTPKAAVIRDHNDSLIQPLLAGFVTCPAPNARFAKENKVPIGDIEYTMSKRIFDVLKVCEYRQHTVVVLGAWGCGVFENDPEQVARLFNNHLKSEFNGVFEKIVFAIPTTSRQSYTFEMFKKHIKP